MREQLGLLYPTTPEIKGKQYQNYMLILLSQHYLQNVLMSGFIPLSFKHQTGLCHELSCTTPPLKTQRKLGYSLYYHMGLAVVLLNSSSPTMIFICSSSLAWRKITSSLGEENWLEKIICSGPTFYSHIQRQPTPSKEC